MDKTIPSSASLGIRHQVRAALVALLILTLLTGGIYPLAVTALAQALFPWQANGSLLLQRNDVRGSALIGQFFDQPQYFWSRPSATLPMPYNAAASSGSNYGPLAAPLADAVRARVQALRAADPTNRAPIPVDLVTASGSGLDPHISPAAAEYQVARVARARGLDSAAVRRLVRRYTEGPTFGILGEARVNVVLLNLALDAGEATR